SYLLGTEGRSQFFFSDDPNASSTVPFAWYQTQLGAPQGDFAKLNGVYQRQFVTGKVLVNPTTSPATVDLGGTYYTLARQQVTSVTVAPNTGVILTSS
ncbi:MAG: hypothetical protein ACRDQH_08850, partial [Pseudonocardiaceae bacterium]